MNMTIYIIIISFIFNKLIEYNKYLTILIEQKYILIYVYVDIYKCTYNIEMTTNENKNNYN